MADKIAIAIQYLSTFGVGIAMALSTNPKLALVSMSLTPLIVLSTIGVGVVCIHKTIAIHLKYNQYKYNQFNVY